MSYKNTNKMSIDEFRRDLSRSAKYVVDINSLFSVCGASPVRGNFKADKIVISTTYPESIWLVSGENYIDICQIQDIVRSIDDIGRRVYSIRCGRLAELEKTVTIISCEL